MKIQKWGNSLAIRIPSAVARQVGFQLGQPVRMTPQQSALLISPTGKPDLTLAQKLALFDLATHGGESMATTPTGREVL